MGISKLISEQRVRRHTDETPSYASQFLYSEHLKSLSESAVSVIGKKVLDRTKTHMEDNFSVRRPLYIDDLCEFITECVEKGPRGTRHFGNPNDKVTKYLMAKNYSKLFTKAI